MLRAPTVALYARARSSDQSASALKSEWSSMSASPSSRYAASSGGSALVGVGAGGAVGRTVIDYVLTELPTVDLDHLTRDVPGEVGAEAAELIVVKRPAGQRGRTV